MDAIDTGYAPSRWLFDEEVTRVFADMLPRSIPNYDVMRHLVAVLGRPYAQGGLVIDIGSSLGEAMVPHLEKAKKLIGYEISESMCLQATNRFAEDSHVSILCQDITTGLNADIASLILGILTIMFIPINRRLSVISDIYDHLAPKGAFIMVEKIIGETSEVDALMVAEYYAMKTDNGYSLEAIERKRLSLQGALIPLTGQMNESMLQSAGFSTVECFWRWMNFAAWIAIK